MVKRNKSFVVTIKKYIDENYSDWRLSMDFFVGLVGFSAVYINRIYKEIYGISPIEYLANIRLEKAKELIELGTPIGMAAYEVGFITLRTFNRAFKKNTGMSPGKYKQRSLKTYEQFKEVVKLRDLRPLDYARKACDSIMFMHDPMYLPIVADLEGITRYSFMQGIFLEGMYRTHKLCGERKYLNYISEWIEAVTGEDGKIRKYEKHPAPEKRPVLDTFQPIRLFLDMYNETGEQEYLKFSDYYMSLISKWRVAEYGLFVHSPSDAPYMVCLNSVYMLCPSMCMYGRVKNEDMEYYDVAVHQPMEMYRVMSDPETGLLFHRLEKGAAWSDPETGLSNECWGRGMGYYIMGIIDMLDYLPKEHKSYGELCELAGKVFSAIAKYQHTTGRWYQIIDRDDVEENWLENSCSCMFVYAFAKAINLGIIDKEYATVAMRGYSGIIDTIEYAENGAMILRDVSDTANVGDSFIEKMSPHINDPYGTGAFVIMCTEIEELLNNY